MLHQDNKETNNDDSECSDENEYILTQLILEQMNPGRIDLKAVGNYSTTNEKYINRLIGELDSVIDIMGILQQKMKRVNDETGKNVFDTGNQYKFDERVAIEYDKVPLTTIPVHAKKVDLNTLTEKAKVSKTYKRIRNTKI